MAINLKQNADMSAGLQGTDGGEGEFVILDFRYNALANTTGAFLTVSGFVLSRRMVVKSIVGVTETLATNAVTAALWKAPSGTALASGVALHTGTYNLVGTAATNQIIPLVTAVASLPDLLLAAGDRLAIDYTGTATSAIGCVTVTLAPA